MAFGVYVHIPYCRQICPYCDFSKYKIGSAPPPELYIQALRSEIRSRERDVPFRNAATLYFGGGTPSAIDPSLILAVIEELANAGFRLAPDVEASIEIDPETIDERKLDAYLAMGFTRFSVGAQSFNDRLLKIAGRQHDGRGAARALTMLAKRGLKFSFDLLFALPSQTLAEVALDVRSALAFTPSHVSAYCLTVPDAHPMQQGRAPEEEQAEMFGLIESELAAAGIARYEISNFARPGSESRHNLLYWTDQPYWGLGVGAHSYLPIGPFGSRFWNPPGMHAYLRQAHELGRNGFRFGRDLPTEQFEALAPRQALTDFCHTSLRLARGLEEAALARKFGPTVSALAVGRLREGLNRGWIERDCGLWRLSAQGKLLANQVFELTTFLEEDLAVV